jgi:serine/threonine-protein kinase
VTDRVGQVLGGRYRLLAPIGTGASASVYLADDVTLRRRVAVKVLHDALADDDAFLRRFQAEAQAAAALNHPHIMAVYDWGDGGGDELPYLVMEYLAGGSLRALLDTSYHLSLSQALLVGLEAARGLDYAHRRGFVHRDIKPANLLFDDEARLRIADFGLARALAEAAWTEPMGAVLGTARYASPEQARGEKLDGRSDVYSLALVLVESVTGQVPFAADTTIGTLMARVDRPIPVPLELGPLRPALEAAGRPDPAERISAGELADLLLAAAEELNRPDPLPIVGAMHGNDAHLPDREPTAVAPDPAMVAALADTEHDGIVVVADADAGEPALGANAGTPRETVNGQAARRNRWAGRRQGSVAASFGERGERGDDGSSIAVLDDDTFVAHRSSALVTPVSAGPSSLFDYEADGDLSDSDHGWRSRRRRTGGRSARAERPVADDADAPRGRRWYRRVAAMVLVVILAAGGFGYWYTAIRVPTYTVASFIGQQVAEVRALAAERGWVIAETQEYADGTSAGQVLAQRPDPGADLARGGTLDLTVSLGPPPVAVPSDLAGLPIEEARGRLEAVGLQLGEQVRLWNEDIPADSVVSLGPDTPAELPLHTPVPVVVSAGPPPRPVPDGMVGKASDQAVSQLKQLGLVPEIVEEFSETVPKGVVLDVTPEAGALVAKGDKVRLVVSKGPQLIAVPNVRGLSVVDAAARIEAAGLAVSGTQGSPTRPVTGTNPAAGTLVRKGSSVTLVTD